MIKAITTTTTDRTVWSFILRINISNGIFFVMKVKQGSERLYFKNLI
jgi:hypothetical protein